MTKTPDWLWPAPHSGSPAWQLLHDYTARGYLLHGSHTPGLLQLETRTPIDHSLDQFSKTTAIYATDDPTWAIAYAIRSHTCRGFLNACFQPTLDPHPGTPPLMFLSYAPDELGNPALEPGTVYVLPRDTFTRMPSYRDPVLGPVTECQWISTDPVTPHSHVDVTPNDLPRPPRTHDYQAVRHASQIDPLGFPWLEAKTPRNPNTR